MKISSRAIVIRAGKVLLMYREKNGEAYYAIPGGKTEPNENLEDTVVREVLEETSINVIPSKFLGKFTHTEEEKEQNLFLCEYVSGEPKLGDSVEMEKMSKDTKNYYRPEWVSIKNVSNLKIRPDPCEIFFKEFIKKQLNS